MFFPPFQAPVVTIRLPLFQEAGIEVFMKREDLVHPFISGNKWRKLKYILEDAREKGKSTLVGFGGPYSNHLVAMACAGATFGFQTKGFVRGEEVKNHVMMLCRLWGMELTFVTREAYR